MCETRTDQSRSWVADESGSVATMFGLVAITFLAFGGMTIDQSRGYSVKTDLQAAMDAAAIATARYKMDYPDADARALFKKQMMANWSNKSGAKPPVLTQFLAENNVVTATAATSLPTTFMGLLGHDTLSVSTNTALQYGTGQMEIALVLDNTFSMNGDKLNSLKDSAKLLVNSLKPHSTPSEHVSFSLVPFAQYVNVGTSNRSANWITVPNDYTDSNYSCQMVRPVISKSNCRTETRTGMKDGVSYTYQTEVCDNIEYGEAEEQCGTNTVNQVWRGCVGSRDNPLDTKDQDYNSDPVIGLLDLWCPSEIGPLTNSKMDIINRINGMGASGQTYIPTGLMWGWRTLSDSEPFDQATPYSDKSTEKVLVLMTDGANTQSASYPKHDGTDSSDANDLTETVCNRVKAKGVKIFTVTFDVTDTTIKSLMANCASSSSSYFDAGNSDELEESFQSIADALVDIRFTH